MRGVSTFDGCAMSDEAPHRITSVTATEVRVARIAPLRSALGVSHDGSFGVVEIETDSGLHGIGEIAMIWNGGGGALCSVVNDLLGPALLGQSAMGINSAHRIMAETIEFSRAANPAKAAVDM